MKIDIENLKDWLDPKSIGGNMTSLLEKSLRYFIFAIMLALAGYGTFIWYQSVYHSQWSSGRVQEYAKTKDKGTILNKGKFSDIVSERGKRATSYQEGVADLEDIFRLKK